MVQNSTKITSNNGGNLKVVTVLIACSNKITVVATPKPKCSATCQRGMFIEISVKNTSYNTANATNAQVIPQILFGFGTHRIFHNTLW